MGGLKLLLLDKPFSMPTTLQKDHEQAENITASYLFNDQDASDYVDGNDLAVSGATWTEDGIKFVNSGDIITLDNTGDNVINSDYGAICMYIKSFSSFDDSVSRYFIHNASGSILIRKHSNNVLIFRFYNGVTIRAVNYISSSFPNWQTGTHLCFVWNKDRKVDNWYHLGLYIDGVLTNPYSVTNATALDSFSMSSDIGIGNLYPGGGNPMNCEIQNMDFYSKNTNEAKVLSLRDNPYAMYLSSFPLFGFWAEEFVYTETKMNIGIGIGL